MATRGSSYLFHFLYSFYAIKFLNRIIDELNNIDKFIENPDKNIPNLTRYALEMVLIIISLCVKKHVPEKLLLEYPLNLTISSVGNQSITMSLTWSYLKAVKKRFMHYSHKFNNDSVKHTALSVTGVKTRINAMLLAIQQQYPQRLVKEYFSYSIKNMLSGISGFAQEFPRPWPEVWRMHLNINDLFEELNNERALRMKTKKQYANTSTLITSFFCPPSQWLVFIIKPSKELPTKANIKYLNLVKGQSELLPYAVKMSLLRAYFKADIKEIDLALLSNNPSLPKFTKANMTSPVMLLNEQDVLNHYYNVDLRDYVLSLSPAKGASVILPQVGVFFKTMQEVKIALANNTVNDANTRLLLAVNINAHAWVLFIVETANEIFKSTTIRYIVASMLESQSLPSNFTNELVKIFPKAKIEKVPLIQTTEIEYGKIVVRHIKAILENRLNLITGEVTKERKKEKMTATDLESESLEIKEKTDPSKANHLPFFNSKKHKQERSKQMENPKSEIEKLKQEESSSDSDEKVLEM